jgi:CubicO group peptidase (beta-lactamase class C family)
MTTLRFLIIFLSIMNSVFADPPARTSKIEAKNILSPSEQNDMIQEMANALKNMKMPSLVAAATVGNKVIWYEGIGYADYDKKIKVNPVYHMYRWASVTKVATDLLIKSQNEKGVLDIDEPISNYYHFPTLKYLNRCLTPSTLAKYFQCQKDYGNGPLENIRGTCFDAETFDKFETDKGYNVWIEDKNSSSGNIIYKNKEGTERCKVKYEISEQNLDSSDPEITLAQLINHTSGIQHYSHLKNDSNPPESLMSNIANVKARMESKQSQMKWAIPYFFPKHPLLSRPGRTKTYSTFGYNLAGRLLEVKSGKRYEDLFDEYSSALGANSIQPDYLGIPSQGNYSRTFVYKFSNNKFHLNNYTTDNSFKMAGGGIMSTIVDLGRFCVGISKDGVFISKGVSGYTHSGAHPDHSLSRLSLSTKEGQKQCLVIMTNTNHKDIDLGEVSKKLSDKLRELGHWK